MSKNSKNKRDKKKATERKRVLANASTKIDFENGRVVARELTRLFSPKLLTTPKEINSDILIFCASISDSAPIFMTAQPEPWSRQACCDRNVEEYVALHEGEIVCGYRIWFNDPTYIEAERHAIWHKAGTYRDISFSPDGEEKFLFVADRPERQANLTDNSPRIRWGKDYETRKLIEIQVDMESTMNVGKMSDEQAWNTMPSYLEWQNGKRMSSIVAVESY